MGIPFAPSADGAALRWRIGCLWTDVADGFQESAGRTIHSGINAGASLGVAFVMLLFGGSITAGAFSLSGFFSVLLGAFIGAMLIMALILFFSTLIKSNIMLLITVS